jgi:hypothetical protein
MIDRSWIISILFSSLSDSDFNPTFHIRRERREREEKRRGGEEAKTMGEEGKDEGEERRDEKR